MTEKEVYKNGVALLKEWEDVNYCEHSFKFKDEWLTDKEVVDLLNELHEENQHKQKLLHLSANKIENLLEENEQLKSLNKYLIELLEHTGATVEIEHIKGDVE